MTLTRLSTPNHQHHERKRGAAILGSATSLHGSERKSIHTLQVIQGIYFSATDSGIMSKRLGELFQATGPIPLSIDCIPHSVDEALKKPYSKSRTLAVVVEAFPPRSMDESLTTSVALCRKLRHRVKDILRLCLSLMDIHGLVCLHAEIT